MWMDYRKIEGASRGRWQSDKEGEGGSRVTGRGRVLDGGWQSDK